MAGLIKPLTIFQFERAKFKALRENNTPARETDNPKNNQKNPDTASTMLPPLSVEAKIVGTETRTNQAKAMYIDRLQSVDAEVRAHERAHMAAADGYARGGPHYNYIIGPDGKLYAVGGSIQVDLSPVPGNPEATIRKARIIRRAAYAVMDPSSADMQVAARAYRMEMQAQRELERERSEKTEEQEGKNRRQPIALYA
jgi:hypothetical protein